MAGHLYKFLLLYVCLVASINCEQPPLAKEEPVNTQIPSNAENKELPDDVQLDPQNAALHVEVRSCCLYARFVVLHKWR